MSTTDKSDAVELLLQQHRHIRELFSAVDKAADDETKQERFEELRRFLAVHETAEELITHPRARMVDGGNSVVDARLEEETASKKLLASLDGMKVEDPNFDSRFKQLKKAVLDHAAAEERTEFPLLRQSSQSELAVMARAIQAAEAIAPTHPHPSVGSAMTTNLMAGPLASVIDRTKDAVTAVLRG
jgi:hemerythrin superfamily protein